MLGTSKDREMGWFDSLIEIRKNIVIRFDTLIEIRKNIVIRVFELFVCREWCIVCFSCVISIFINVMLAMCAPCWCPQAVS